MRKFEPFQPRNYKGGLPLPDAPEPIECDGEFRSDVCDGCSEYGECKRIAEEGEPNDTTDH